LLRIGVQCDELRHRWQTGGINGRGCDGADATPRFYMATQRRDIRAANAILISPGPATGSATSARCNASGGLYDCFHALHALHSVFVKPVYMLQIDGSTAHHCPD
jgi:hypothetical protein